MLAKCQYCGESFYQHRPSHKYCSPKCAQLAQPFYKDRKEIPKQCVFCHQVFITMKRNQKYCSSGCYKAASRLHLISWKKEHGATLLLKLRFEVFLRDLFRCRYCGRTAKDGAILEADHVIPVKEGGKTELENLVTSCRECNLGKGDVFLPSKLPI